MGQKSNLETLRKSNLQYNLITQNPKEFVYGLKFLQFFSNLFYKKKIIIVEKNLNFESNKLFLNLSLFFQTTKLLNFQKKISSKKLNGGGLNFSSLYPLIRNHFSLLNNNFVQVSLTNLNYDINEKSLTFFFNKLRRFSGALFTRRFNLFVDFIKIAALFGKNKVNSKTFLFVVGQVFRTLPKRKHNIFLIFLKTVFQVLIENKSILGVKFLISGRLKGKPRSSTVSILMGSTPVQSLSENIEYSKTNVYTLNGAFGFKLWVYR